MPRYAIAFVTAKSALLHKLVEMDSHEAALRFFFKNHVGDAYTPDDEGYGYFKDDFTNAENPMGSILEV